MSKQFSSYRWLIVISFPSLFLLVASSTQFRQYSPLVVSSAHWYIAMLITGMVACTFVRELHELVYAAGIVFLINMVGYASIYYICLWIIYGHELALLGVYTTIQPILLYTVLGALLFVAGLVLGVVGFRDVSEI